MLLHSLMCRHKATEMRVLLHTQPQTSMCLLHMYKLVEVVESVLAESDAAGGAARLHVPGGHTERGAGGGPQGTRRRRQLAAAVGA
jgi:hypothetical protein